MIVTKGHRGGSNGRGGSSARVLPCLLLACLLVLPYDACLLVARSVVFCSFVSYDALSLAWQVGCP